MDLQIRLDQAGASRVEGGDQLTGAVHVVVDEEVETATLAVVLGVEGASAFRAPTGLMSTRQADDERLRVVLFEGAWTPGTQTHPFRIEVPAGPYSYEGQIIFLRWYLQAEVRASNGRAVRSERTPITVVPSVSSEPDAEPIRSARVTHAEAPRGSFGCLLISVTILLAGVAGLWAAIQPGGWEGTGFELYGIGIGLVLILVNVYQFLVSRKFGAVDAWIEHRAASPGERVRCGVTFQVKRPAEIEGVRAILTAVEQVRVKRGRTVSGPNADRVLHEATHELPVAAGSVPARVPIVAEGEVVIPSTAPFSFDEVKEFGGGIALAWTIEFRVVVRSWPDWVHREQILVLPGRQT